MVVEAQPLLKMWYNDIKRDHRRALNKYVGALTELINMNGLPKLIKVLTDYWDNERMVFQLKIIEITLTIDEVQDCIDIVGTGLE